MKRPKRSIHISLRPGQKCPAATGSEPLPPFSQSLWSIHRGIDADRDEAILVVAASSERTLQTANANSDHGTNGSARREHGIDHDHLPAFYQIGVEMNRATVLVNQFNIRHPNNYG